MRLNYRIYSILVIASIYVPWEAQADVYGAGIGATTGSSTVTSTQGIENSHISGTANVGSASSSGVIISSTPPSRDQMVYNPVGKADWITEDAYWRTHYLSRPYSYRHMQYAQFQPAYRYGVELYRKHGDQEKFSDLDQTQLRADWEEKNAGPLNWEKAEPATRDAYDKLYAQLHNKASSAQ